MAMNPNKKMLMANLFGDINESSSSDIEIKMIPLDLIDDRVIDGEGHPFEKSMMKGIEELAESIKIIGIQQPIVVVPNGERYLSLAGHRRRRAAAIAGLKEVPAIVKDIEPFSPTADLIVTDTNLKNRKALYPSEIASAYQMQLEALKQQGKRSDLTEQVDNLTETVQEDNVTARDLIAERYETSSTEISKYVRLLKLIPELLAKVDEGKISVRAGYSLSFLEEWKQKKLISADEISISEADTLRRMTDEEWENYGSDERTPSKKEKVKTYSVATAAKKAAKQYKDRIILSAEEEAEIIDFLSESLGEFLRKKGLL